jgi:hypothetical protein
MVRATFARHKKPPRKRSPQPFRRYLPTVEQLETRNVLATAITPSGSLTQQLVATTPTGQVSVQVAVIDGTLFINNAAAPTTTGAAVPLDVISAVQSVAATDLTLNVRTTEVRVLVLVRANEGPIVVETVVLSSFAPVGVVTFNPPAAASPAGAQPLPANLQVADPLVSFPRYLWVADQPPAPGQSNFLEQPAPDNNPQQPPADQQAPAVPPLPPVINFPIPLGQLDYSEPRVVVMVRADENTAEPIEQRLEAPILPPTLPPTSEEDASPTPVVAALAVALLGFPGAVAAERQRRAGYHDRSRDMWVW